MGAHFLPGFHTSHFLFFFNIHQGTQIATVRKEICEGQKATDGSLCWDRSESIASAAYLD